MLRHACGYALGWLGHRSITSTAGLYGSGARKIQGFLERLRSSLRNNPPRPSSPSPMQCKSPPCQLQPEQNQPNLWERFPGCTKAIFGRHILPPVAADRNIMMCTGNHTYFAAIGDMPCRRCDDRSLGSNQKIARSITSGRRLPNDRKIPAPPWTIRENGIIPDSDAASHSGDVR
jgi:hypothetical protein